jgi:hypothetical protein
MAYFIAHYSPLTRPSASRTPAEAKRLLTNQARKCKEIIRACLIEIGGRKVEMYSGKKKLGIFQAMRWVGWWGSRQDLSAMDAIDNRVDTLNFTDPGALV